VSDDSLMFHRLSADVARASLELSVAIERYVLQRGQARPRVRGLAMRMRALMDEVDEAVKPKR